MNPHSSASSGGVPAWTKSSYSTNDGPGCVEVARRRSAPCRDEGACRVGVGWRKSSHSAGNTNDCVEVASASDAVLIRDSKDPDGPHLHVTPGAWRAFLAFARAAAV